MAIFNLLLATLFTLVVTAHDIYTEEISIRKEGSVKPPLVVNPIEHLTLDQDSGLQPEQSVVREKRQNFIQAGNGIAETKPPFNPLEDLILNQDNNGMKPEASLSRVKRQYGYPYPYPIPIFIGGGFGGFGGRGYGGRGFGGGYGGRGFGGGFGGRGGGGGFGGRGGGGGFGGGRGGGGGRG